MTSAVQLLRDQVAKELSGSVTIIGKPFLLYIIRVLPLFFFFTGGFMY